MILDPPGAAEALLVDPRFGVLTAVRRDPYPGMPSAWIGYGATVADTRAFAGWSADPFGFGASIGDPARARGAAVGEAVERYCGRAVQPSALVHASWDELAARGLAATDPVTFALYSARQYATPGFPFVPFTRSTRVAWVEGRDLDGGGPVLVPASTVYLDYRDPQDPAGHSQHALSYAGIAAGADRSQAERYALEELFERDATTIWWLSGSPAQRVEDGEQVTDLLDDRHLPARRATLLRIPSPFGVPVIGAFLQDPTAGLVAFGSAARADPVEAATKALVEALGLWQMTEQLADPDSDLWRARAESKVPAHTFVPFRADRRYADTFRSDRRDLVDLPAVAQLYLDPRMQGRPLDRLRPDGPGVRLQDVAPVVGPDVVGTYLARLGAEGLRSVSADVTTPDVAAAGLCVVRVVVPGLYGNAPAAFPYLGGDRLYRIPTEHGWRAGTLTEDTVVTDPIPLA